MQFITTGESVQRLCFENYMYTRVVECLQKDNTMAEANVHRHRSRQSLTREPKKAIIDHECRLNRLLRENLERKQLLLLEFLESIGKCVQLA
ncbi:hypothetical protein DPMN_111574 [Dreissena polymorpha]|uniref:Uncharacterized protein n=1 Tax=Dreissena polymorpha TaxID=45954 RepID=A0A9D4KF66_DREPO|nr:hypothetical protein DPMN_111574 [Dreissena polymorpha]